MQHDVNSPAKTVVGTPVYMAPEIILAAKHYDAKVSQLTHYCFLHAVLRVSAPQHCCIGSSLPVMTTPQHHLSAANSLLPPHLITCLCLCHHVLLA